MPSIIRPIRLVAAACIAFAAAAAAQEAVSDQAGSPDRSRRRGRRHRHAFRTIAPFWGEELGQPVVVENKPGAGQIVGSDFVAKAKPDGYTLLAAGVPIAFNTALGRKLPYDAVRDFTPLSLVVTQPLLIVVHPSVPANSMKDLLAYAKAQPAAAALHQRRHRQLRPSLVGDVPRQARRCGPARSLQRRRGCA
jgi:hypothetical protein